MEIIKHFGDKALSLQKLLNSANIAIDQISISTQRIILAEQVHSANVEIVTEENTNKPIPDIDGLITGQKNLFLCIKTADCIPIFIWDENQKVIAALHSGRAGTEHNIVGKAVEIMKNKFSCDPRNIRVELGPSICGKCYHVDQKTFNDFINKTRIEQTQPNLNLKKVVISNLLEIGIRSDKIFDYQICTKENENYFSFREDLTSERQISIIGMV